MLKDITAKVPAYAEIMYDVLSFIGGMNSRSSEIFLTRDSRYSMAKNQARLMVNLVRTKSGILTTRPGRVKLNAVAIAPAAGDAVVRSIFELQAATTNHILANIGNGVFKYDGAGGFASLGTVANSNLRMLWCQFKDKALGINGANTMVRYDGTTFDTVAAAPTTGAAIAAHRNRVWILAGRTLSYCALGVETDWTTANNAGSIPVPTSKGTGGTGLVALWDRLIVVTGSQVFQVVGSGPSDFAIEPINLQNGHQGSPYAIIPAGNDIYYVNKRGIHSLSTALTQSITGDVSYNYASAQIEPTWQQVNINNLPNIVAVHDSLRNQLIFLCNRIGTTNIEAFVADYYHLDDNGHASWAMYSNMPFASACEVLSIDGTPRVLFGSQDGFVYEQTDAETDNGSPIPTQLTYLTDLEIPVFTKLWRHLLLFASGPSTILSGNITYDFGDASIPFTADIDVGMGDTIGGTFEVGHSILGPPGLKEVRIPVPSHGRFATININTNSVHRVIIGGFIIYAGVRRMIKH